MTTVRRTNAKRRIKCPTCGTLVIYDTTNPYRPFCSERCKEADLAAWASEQYRIPAESSEASQNSGTDEIDEEDD